MCWRRKTREKLEGLGAVRSSRVRRLARSRKGVFNRPSGLPVSVRGFEWDSLVLVGKEGRPHVVAMRWWGRVKGVEGQQRKQQERLLVRAARQWKHQVRHVARSRLWHRSLALATLPL